MAKRTRATRQPNRRTVSRLEREARMRRWLYIGMGALFGLIVILVGAGVYVEYVARPRRVVAVVHGDTIRLDEYQRLVRFRQYSSSLYLSNLEDQRAQFAGAEGQGFMAQFIDQQIQRTRSELLTLPQTVVEDLIEDRLIRQEAARRGITVTEDEVQTELERQFGFERNPPTPEPPDAQDAEPGAETTPTPAPDQAQDEPSVTETPTPVPTPMPTPVPMTYDEFVANLEGYLNMVRQATGFTERELRRSLESSLLRTKVEEVLVAEMPTTAEQVRALHILVETQEEADQVLARLAAGEAFEDLARELSTDTASAEGGGDLGWFPRGVMAASFEQVAFGLAPQETSAAVESQFGVHIIRVLERELARELEPADLEAFQSQLLSEWYIAQRNAEGIEVRWDASMAPS